MTTGNAQNNTGWGSKEYDNLLKSEWRIIAKPKERFATMRQAEAILNDAPVAPIYQKGTATLRNPQVKGMRISSNRWRLFT